MASTIHDVALAAGVGIGTVSRVLNNNPNVTPTTREKVLAAITQLHYRPNPIARSMISKKTGAIGVIVPFFTRPFFSAVLHQVEATLTQAAQDLILYNVSTDAQRDHYFADVPMHHRVDGLLIISLSPNDASALHLQEVGLPIVLLDAYSPYLTSFVVDNIDGAYQAINYFIQQGHRRIGFINGIIEGNFKFNQANDRLIGVHRALAENYIQFDPELLLSTEWTREGGKSAALDLLQQPNRPTAIFAASDIQAVGVLEAANELHISIPNDLALIGYDGIELAEMLGLSTIQQPIQQMGQLGVEKLMQLLASPQDPPELIRLQTTLVTRRTTKPTP